MPSRSTTSGPARSTRPVSPGSAMATASPRGVVEREERQTGRCPAGHPHQAVAVDRAPGEPPEAPHGRVRALWCARRSPLAARRQLGADQGEPHLGERRHPQRRPRQRQSSQPPLGAALRRGDEHRLVERCLRHAGQHEAGEAGPLGAGDELLVAGVESRRAVPGPGGGDDVRRRDDRGAAVKRRGSGQVGLDQLGPGRGQVVGRSSDHRADRPTPRPQRVHHPAAQLPGRAHDEDHPDLPCSMPTLVHSLRGRPQIGARSPARPASRRASRPCPPPLTSAFTGSASLLPT